MLFNLPRQGHTVAFGGARSGLRRPDIIIPYCEVFMPEPTGEPAASSTGQSAMMKCPLCRSRYPADPALEGKRVRCPRCGHVWRDQRGDLRRVVGALGEAAENWAELGSTTLAA